MKISTVIFFFSLFLLSAMQLNGQLKPSTLSISYDPCNANLIVKYKYKNKGENSCLDNDQLRFFEITYVDGGVEKGLYYTYSKREVADPLVDRDAKETAWELDHPNIDFRNTDFTYDSGPPSDGCTSDEFGYVAPYGTVVDYSLGRGFINVSGDPNGAVATIPMPPSTSGSITLKFKGKWDWWSTCCYAGGPGVDFWTSGDFMLTTPGNLALQPINSFSATTNVCDKINLSWTVPTAESCTVADRKIFVEQKRKNVNEAWTQIGFAPYYTYASIPTSSPIVFTPPGIVASGTEYDFRIKHDFDQNQYRDIISDYASTSGNTEAPPLAPSLNNPVGVCDANQIDLSWSPITLNCVGYEIERSRVTNFSTIEKTISINSSTTGSTSDTDNTLETGVPYHYRIFALNKCGDRSPLSGYKSTSLLSRPVAPSDLMVTVDNVAGKIHLSWKDNSINETEWVVVRGTDDLPVKTSTTTTSTGGARITYMDEQIEPCINYTYSVIAVNACGRSAGSPSANAIAQPTLSSAFSAGYIDASKGYFTNRVQLEWSLSGNAENLIDKYKIARRVFGTVDPFVVLEQIDGGGIYNDLIADAGVLYQYQVYGFADCGSNGAKIYSDTITTIGFRSKSGLVTGNVSYDGGNAVKGAKILAESSEPSIGKSIALNGGKLIIDHHVNQNLDSNLIIDAWIKPGSFPNDFVIAKKPGSFDLSYDHGAGQIVFKVINNGFEQSIGISKDTFPAGHWKQITVQVSDSIYIYRNGGIVARTSLSTSPAILNNPPNTPIELFKDFNGNAVEFRLWRKSKSHLEVFRDASRFVTGLEKGLVSYLPMNEGFGDKTYDRSKISASVYNKNDGTLMDGAVFDNDLPGGNQLSHAAYTDTVGNYILYLPFTNAGENYELFPQYLTHEFDPKKRLLYIGDGSTILNNVDFLDKSSFKMEGTLKYKGTNVAVPGATVKIDGNIVQVNGSIVKTDADGMFAIQVPIGHHYIEVEKPGHAFSIGRFPPGDTTAWDFQYPIGPEFFEDSTLIKVVGRAVGGSIQGDKPPGMERSTNNIGEVKIKFAYTDPDKGWYVGDPALKNIRSDTTITTNPQTGEYSIELPPWVFNIPRVELTKAGFETAIDFESQPALDLRYEIEAGKVQTLKKEIDTLFLTNTNTISRIDSVEYHRERNFIYYADPSIEVLTTDGEDFRGDTLAFFEHSKYPFDTINLNTSPLSFPVLTSGRQYDTEVHIFEEYFNVDQPQAPGDRVPVIKGDFVITNQLAIDPELIIDLEAADTLNGVIPYSFIAGDPFIQKSGVDSAYSYTKIFRITITDPDFIPHEWEPFETAATLPELTNPNKYFRAYIFGAINDPGTNFAVQGPSVLSYILRDPPGGGSFSTLTTGSSRTESLNWAVSGGIGTDLNKIVKLGTKLTFGLGSYTTAEATNTTTIGLNVDPQFGHNESLVTSSMTNTTISTSSNPNNVGAGSDLFIGSSNNYLFGTSRELGVFSEDACNSNVAECFGPAVDGYRLGEATRFGLEGKEIATDFFLTQKDIENYEIPYLIKLRDDLLKNHPDYISTVMDTLSEFYGRNNDDFEAFGQDTCRCYHWLPSTFPQDGPPSYNYRITDQDSVDQVRVFNEQIRLWKEALALNERDKIESIEKVQNWTFDGGGSSLERTVTTDTTITKGFTWEVVITEKIHSKIGASLNSTGVEVENSIMITEKTSGDETTETNNSTTVGYTITDDDIYDRYTVDVIPSKMGFGPIFKIRGGETSCPHEGELRSKYYQEGTLISTGTEQLEKPTIDVVQDELTNIPDGEAADFLFILGNDSKDTWVYTLGLSNSSNPGQAIIVNSGTSELASDFRIAAGENIPVHILIERGGAYKHEDLLFVLKSACQYDPDDFDVDIADSVSVSVEFIPTCTDIEIYRPADNWILNKSFDNEMEIIISDYDYNITNFDNFTLWSKASSAAEFMPLHAFYKDTTGVSSITPYSEISNSTISTTYIWDVSGLPDADYELKVTSDCIIASEESEIHSGFIDRDPIEVFGTPSPADGILDPNDDILLTMNELIVAGGITDDNFDVRGVLNGTEIKHETSLNFDGISGHLRIPEYQLQSRSLSIEFWLKRNAPGKEEVIFAQGQGTQDQILISFRSDDKIRFQVGDAEMVSDSVFDDTDWRHYAFNYDRTTNTAEIFTRHNTKPPTYKNGPMSANYSSSGPIFIGQSSIGSPKNFDGFIHELRLWSIVRTSGDISSQSQITMSGRESGLIGNWPMDEAFGLIAKDKVRSRHAQLNAVNWSVVPMNHSFKFNGTSDFVVAEGTGDLSVFDDQDMTIEGWFKTGDSGLQSILSNGKPDAPFAWNIYLDVAGALIVENDGFTIQSQNGYNDNKWYHFSVVIERTRAVSLYINGDLVQTGNSTDFEGGFNGPKIWIGARGWVLPNQDTVDRFFNGKLDDIRLWDVARKPEQIQRDFVNQMVGDELGLIAYYPFDGITKVGSQSLRSPDLKDAIGIDTLATTHDLSFGGSSNTNNFSEDAPLIKLPRLVEKVNVNYSINGDQIYIEISKPPARIENVTFDITVSGLKDKAGNFMTSPETWIAYINKNQVFWDDEYFNFTKKLEDELSFTSKIKNTGGSQEFFTISNLPSWLKAIPASGLLEPNSSVEVLFIVEPLLNIGKYQQDIFVATESFGFNERLLLDLKVETDPPVWNIIEENFSHSMSIIGQFSVNEIISTDEDDIVSVWVNNELRGVSNVRYDESSGKYLVFLTVLSNVTGGELLEFRAWDASEGRLLVDLTPNVMNFALNDLKGSRTTPQVINATALIELTYDLIAGWNWISFPIQSDSLSDVNVLLDNLTPSTGDDVKSQTSFDTYDGNNWIGTLAGFNTDQAYKIRVSNDDSFLYEGNFENPAIDPIQLVAGWNWIGVKSLHIIDVPSALGNLELRTGDLIKGQRSFALYEEGYGWGGNLEFLEPQKGYLLKHHEANDLYFPTNLNLSPNAPLNVKSRKTKQLITESLVAHRSGHYSSNMSMVASVSTCSSLAVMSNWLLVAHTGDESRGVAEISTDGKYYITIEGDQAVSLNFKLVHKYSKLEMQLNESMDYSSNQLVGGISAPYEFTCGGIVKCPSDRVVRTIDLSGDSQEMTFKAKQGIASNARTSSGFILVLKAGQAVELQESFEIVQGAELEVLIENCVEDK